MRANRTIRYFTAQVKKFPHLTSKEKDVLIGRLRKVTHIKIGDKYNVTEGRIRQIEKMALNKIKLKFYQQKLFK